jgi:hypothetical protein
MQLHQEDAFADLADNPSLPLEFVILEAEEEPPYEIARIGEFLHILGSPIFTTLLKVLCEPVLVRPFEIV